MRFSVVFHTGGGIRFGVTVPGLPGGFSADVEGRPEKIDK
jgi:hypothetical protein